ncbi:MrpH family fimbial adhesin [Providencia sp.]|uniref:MrpH family fimbial adhesin n=1 Tax=Providencia sp. TaxID=589 RepID=UPI000E7DACA2|nr:adhesin [Providencia sp.]MBP6081678.1 adhesin [Providencia sp.]HBO22090.1 adhesin [Providencia sp.]
MKWFLYLFVGAMMTSFGASASIFSYITASDGTPSNATYWFTIERWDDYPDDVLNQCTYNPCYVTINHKHTIAGTPGQGLSGVGVNVTGLKTMKEVRAKFLAKNPLPLSKTTIHNGVALNQNQECVGLFFQPTDGSSFTEVGRMLPGSLCGIAPPPVGACKIENTSLVIDFGPVDEASLPNATKDVTVSVTCNLAMDVLLIASGMNNGRVKLRSDDSLNARLLLGSSDIPGESGIKLSIPKNGTNSVQLKARLDVNGRVAPGPFSGSASLILTMP